MKKKIVASVAGVMLMLAALTGCANGGYTTTGGAINVVTVDLPDGGEVVCVNVQTSVDCDWDGVKR